MYSSSPSLLSNFTLPGAHTPSDSFLTSQYIVLDLITLIFSILTAISEDESRQKYPREDTLPSMPKHGPKAH